MTDMSELAALIRAVRAAKIEVAAAEAVYQAAKAACLTAMAQRGAAQQRLGEALDRMCAPQPPKVGA